MKRTAMKVIGCFCILLAGQAIANEQQPFPNRYVLGPEDQITVRVSDLEEMQDKTVRVDLFGDINLPIVGRIHVDGLSVEDAQTEINARLKTILRDPATSVMVTEFRPQPVSILGAVNQPGIHQFRGPKTLYEVLALAGGLRTEAGNVIKITRRSQQGKIPLPGARADLSGEFYIAEVQAKSVMEASRPEENILMRPHDVISIPKGECVYVIGAVRRPGGFVLSEKENMTVLQALSMAEGLDRTAAAKGIRILRHNPEGERKVDDTVNVSKILAGQANDVSLQANDVLFVPTNAAKSASLRIIEAGIQLGTGIAIFRR